MGRGQIIVETGQLDSTATSIDALADTYNTNYTALYSAVQELQNSWSGQDNTAFTNQIEGFKDDFQRMEKLMREYAAFLKKTAIAYRQTQENVRAGVASLSQGS